MRALLVAAIVAPAAAPVAVWALSWIATGAGSLAYRIDEWRQRR